MSRTLFCQGLWNKISLSVIEFTMEIHIFICESFSGGKDSPSLSAGEGLAKSGPEEAYNTSPDWHLLQTRGYPSHLTGKLCVDGLLSHQEVGGLEMGLWDWLCILGSYCGYLRGSYWKTAKLMRILTTFDRKSIKCLEKRCAGCLKGVWYSWIWKNMRLLSQHSRPSTWWWCSHIPVAFASKH